MTANIVFFLNLFAFFVISFVNGVIIHTKQGSLKGFVSQSRNGRPFYSFHSVPYAEPPLGNLRFANPVPAKPWEGVKDATIESPICINEAFGHLSGQEDCLYLNVYTPKITNETLLPVMVYTYGGRFLFGNARSHQYGAHYFMDRDVILITFHYRLGVFGFLSTEDEIIPGNYGLKDEVAVLEWVQKYIDDFGGDKNRVTLFGGSSGGISVSLTLVSPLAKGLFHGIISQSGHPFDMEKPGKAKLNAWKLASAVGCNGDYVKITEELLHCLRKIPADDLAVQVKSFFRMGSLLPAFPFGPVIENEKTPGAFLVDEPRKLLERKSSIPWIMGMNADEGGMMALFAYYGYYSLGSLSQEFDTNYRKYFPEIFRYIHHVDPKQLDTVTEKYKTYYFGDKIISENIHGLAKMFTSLIYVAGIKEAVKLYKGPKFVYYYDHKNKESFAKMYAANTDLQMGIIHGDELISLYNWSSVITPVTEGVDLTVSEQMLDLWTNFAATGDPNYQDRRIWDPVESSTINYLHIKNGELETKQEFLKSEFDFLDSVPIDGYF
ncbi:juvenile hormone esterase-like [Planococcus citri]|uniref:juvenile hormone esterase-like n=1 Tax=Planococcus citri TaxID=170843 RepID=UPI0031FA422E